MDFASRIKEAQDALTKTKDDMVEMVSMAEAEERDLSDEESITLEALESESERLTKRVTDLGRAEKIAGAKAIQAKAPAIVSRVGNGKDREKGDLIFKMATAQFLAKQHRLTHEQAVSQFYGHDDDLQTIVKSTTLPASTDTAGWAAELVDDSLQGFLDILRATTVSWELLGMAGMQVNFDNFGAITVPNRLGTNRDMSSGWTGERDAIPVKRGTLGSITISPYDWKVISTFSKNLAMRSTPSIEALIRQFIIADTGTQLDFDLFDANAMVAGYRPAGLMEGVTGTAASAATDLFQKVNDDILALVEPLVAADCNDRIMLYFNAVNTLKMKFAQASDGTYPYKDEMSQGRIMGYPFRESNNIPVDEHFCVDAASLSAGVGAPNFTVSDTATLVEMDDDGVQPTMSANYPRSPDTGQVGDAARDVVNTPSIRSLFQTDDIAIKNTQAMSWHRMRSECVNRITGVSY